MATNQLFIPSAGPALPPAQAAACLGGKAAGLLRLRALGLPVPEFVGLPAALFEPALAGLPLTEAGLAARRAHLHEFALPAATQVALRTVLAGWGFPGAAVAVRSSVADEDGATAAFPGMMDSVLNVNDWLARVAAVARVAANAYSGRALAYRQQRGRPWWCSARWRRGRRAYASPPSPNTRRKWPFTPWLGEGLVNGQLVPEGFYLNKVDGQLVAQVPVGQVKRSGTPLLVRLGNTDFEDDSVADAETECHSVSASATLAELYRVGQRLEVALGGPQDVEFAHDMGRLLGAFAQLPSRINSFQTQFEAEYQRFYRLPLADLTAADLLQQIRHLDATLLTRWTTPIINDFRVMMANGTATRRLAQLGVADPEEFLSRYLAGSPPAAAGQVTAAPLASLLPALALRELAQVARQDFPELLPLLQAAGSAPAAAGRPAQVARLAPAFHQRVQHYVARYGDRTMGELKLETEAMRTCEALFYSYLAAYVAAPLPSPAAGAAPASLPAQAAAELTTLLQAKRWWRARPVHSSLAALRRAVARREALHLARTRLFGMYRAAYRALGQCLAAAGTLALPLDIFWLTEAEIAEAAHRGGPAWAALVAARQAEFGAYRVPPAAAAPPADGCLRGTGCYPGQVRGAVVVITDPAQADIGAVRGRIVAALRTDPGWAALFPGCRAVLIERGSALSHSVILLRELGIPTIINVLGLTQQLRSGQQVQLDGRTGEIRVIT